MLKDGWCTVQFNAFLQNKINTQVCFDDVKLLSDYIIYNDDKDFLLPQIMKIHNNIIKYN